jgi:Rhomboid family
VLNLGLGVSGIFPIDNSAHVGGLIAGTAVGFVLCPRYQLGEWVNPLVRRLTNTNKSALSWLAAALICLNVIVLYFIILLLYKQGYVLPSMTQ